MMRKQSLNKGGKGVLWHTCDFLAEKYDYELHNVLLFFFV